MDILDHYIAQEADHIPLLMKSLQNKNNVTYSVLYSNLFNFRVNYTKQSVIVEDDCGLFCGSHMEQKLEIGMQAFIKRMKNASKDTER